MKLIEKLYCKLQKHYSIVTFEIVVVNAAIVPCSNNDLQHNFSSICIREFFVKSEGTEDITSGSGSKPRK